MRQLDHRHIVPLWGFNYAGWEEEGNDEREENQRRPFLVVPWCVPLAPFFALDKRWLTLARCSPLSLQDGERDRLRVPEVDARRQPHEDREPLSCPHLPLAVPPTDQPSSSPDS